MFSVKSKAADVREIGKDRVSVEAKLKNGGQMGTA